MKPEGKTELRVIVRQNDLNSATGVSAGSPVRILLFLVYPLEPAVCRIWDGNRRRLDYQLA
jgi:hypothetical protein